MDGALRKIDRRAAIVRLAIERAAFLDVMGHIRDVHSQPEVAVRQPLDRDRIVEVAGVFSVDGHGRDAPEIGASANVLVADGTAQAHRLGDRFTRVRVGNAPLADDDFGVDARLVDVAEHFGDPTDCAARGGRPPRELDDHHVARRCAAFLARRNEDVHQHAPVERRNVPHAVVAAFVAADDRLVRALDDPDDPAFGFAAVLDALDSDDDTVAVHRFVEERAGNVDVAPAVERPLGRDEPEAVGMRLQVSDVEIHLFGETESMLKELAHGGGMVHPLAHQREYVVV